MEELQVLTDNEVTSKPQQAGEDVKLTLSWEELSVWRTRKTNTSLWKASTQENVQILDRVSGSLQSGMLMAIMGPSGAGKTSLLASVSMREQGTQTGELLLNGAPVTRQQLAKLSGFVPQQDLAFETLTVAEHMEFMARLKMDRHTPESVRKKRINHLVHELSISKCFYTRLSGLSGGERRRLSLAVQLINDPPLLFCDEPTTGLDSWGAGAVVRQLVALSSAGKAVLCSIHQPASGIFDLFHHVLLLAGGRVAYRGPVSEAATFFAQQQLFCPIGYNEAEFLVSAVSSEERAKRVCGAWRTAQLMKTQETLLPSQRLAQNGDREAGRLGGILSLHDELEAADYLSDNPNRLLMKPPIKHSNDVNFDRYFNIEKPGVLVQFSWLMWRSFISAKRDNMIWFVEFLSLMGISLMLAFPFQNVLQTIDQHDIQNIQGLMYLIVTETIFMFIYAVFNKFPSEIAILLREVANGLYSPGPYYLSKILLMIPSAIVEPFIYSTIIFWIVGLKGGLYGFFLFIVPVIFAANCANAYGSWLSATFESIETATLVSVPIDLVSCALSGPFINLASLPAFIGWLKYGSIFFYSSEAISILQWERIEDVACIKDLPCIPTGSEVLKTYGFEQTHYIFDLYGMLLMYLGFHLLGFLALWRRSQKQPVY